MIFEQEKYYSYIQTLEKYKNAIYVIYILLGIIIGMYGGILGVIIGALIGFLSASMHTLGIKIKIQKMKWEMDIYNKIHKE